VDEIGKLLPALFKREVRRPQPHLLEIMVPLWPRVVGKAMAQHSRPISFEFGTLTLHTDCPTWGNQLRQMIEEIRAKVNGLLGQAMVKKLRIKTVPHLETILDAAKERPATPREISSLEMAMICDSIADPEIAAALASSYAKYFHRPRS
jgi:hypothetical protein